MNKQTSVEII